MNRRMIVYILGKLLLVEAVLLILPALVALGSRESIEPFLIPILLLFLCGLILTSVKRRSTALFARDGLIIVSLAWLAMSLFGALPFYISGSMTSFVDCFFETVSGFTTTGASILTEVEHLGRGILFWRSFTHWVGGMGVLVFMMAVLPMTDGNGMHLLRAEVPGPSVGKLVSRLGDTAKILYGIYLAMTVVEILLLLAGGMPLFDASITAFGTAGTGGFSCRNLSIGAYDNAYFDVVISIFMLLFGVNFNLYYFLLIRRVRDVLRSEELWVYLMIVFGSVVTIALNISHLYQSFSAALRHAFFQVSSIITTTGYATADFNLWPSYSKTLLVLLMFLGACASSTGGGIKVARIIILVKTAICDMRKMIHPNAIVTVRMEGRPIAVQDLRASHVFLSSYLAIMALSTLLLSLDQFDMVTTFTAVVACMNNIGPGLEMVGPMGNFAAFSAPAKLLLSFDMLAGRLELFPILLLAPSLWKRRSLHIR